MNADVLRLTVVDRANRKDIVIRSDEGKERKLPPCARVNYLYAVLESEARLAASALGLDPGLGVMHMDTDARDSLASDLMEPVRPFVDEYVLNWVLHQPLKREWFFEERNGRCRLMGRYAERLSETAPTWAQAIAPIAEHVVRALWSMTRQAKKQRVPRRSSRSNIAERRIGVPFSPLSLRSDRRDSVEGAA